MGVHWTHRGGVVIFSSDEDGIEGVGQLFRSRWLVESISKISRARDRKYDGFLRFQLVEVNKQKETKNESTRCLERSRIAANSMDQNIRASPHFNNLFMMPSYFHHVCKPSEPRSGPWISNFFFRIFLPGWMD